MNQSGRLRAGPTGAIRLAGRREQDGRRYEEADRGRERATGDANRRTDSGGRASIDGPRTSRVPRAARSRPGTAIRLAARLEHDSGGANERIGGAYGPTGNANGRADASVRRSQPHRKLHTILPPSPQFAPLRSGTFSVLKSGTFSVPIDTCLLSTGPPAPKWDLFVAD